MKKEAEGRASRAAKWKSRRIARAREFSSRPETLTKANRVWLREFRRDSVRDKDLAQVVQEHEALFARFRPLKASR